jgi:DNA-binding NarL/FixJ family response regulator
MGFWWNENHDTTNKNIPSLDSGITNFKGTEANNLIFASEKFKIISNMFTEDELKIAEYIAQGITEKEIAGILGITYKEVLKTVDFMRTVYNKTKYNKANQQETVSYEAVRKR